MDKKTSTKKRFPFWIKAVLLGLLSLTVVATAAVGGVIYYFSKDLPALDNLKQYEPSQATRVYSDDRRVIGQFYTEKRLFIPLTEIPEEMSQAILAVEDSRFYEHKGFDTLRILKAFLTNLEKFEIRQGASTITQQLTRALFLTPERTFTRKVKEILLARKIETVLTKDQILELYLNQIYFGNGAYGVQVAARTYFGKDAHDLDLAEAALLAGLPKAPNNYSPYHNPKAAKSRQRIVLKRMREKGYITKARYKRALDQELVFKEKDLGEDLAPYFNEYIRQYLTNQYGVDRVYKGGLNVYSTLNIKMQEAAERALKKGLVELAKRQGNDREAAPSKTGAPLVEGAIIVLDPTTGGVKAMVGGYDFRLTEFNRAVQAIRQPGSAFKPIIFGAAIENGLTPSSLVVDNPLIFRNQGKGKDWKPENYSHKFHGQISLREALIHSRNLATINLLSQVGIDRVIPFARRLGITSPLTRDLSLALGTSGVSLLELTSAYSVFANRGVRVDPRFWISISDHTGETLEQKKTVPVRVVSEETSFIVTDMLEDVIREGTARRASIIDRSIAGKTGTTNDFIDAWFVGYTPNLVVGVWCGFDDRRTLGESESGGHAVLPVWIDFMQEVLPQLPRLSFPVPDNVIYTKIDPATGFLASPDAGEGKKEVFVRGTEPKESKTERADPTDFLRLDAEEGAI